MAKFKKTLLCIGISAVSLTALYYAVLLTVPDVIDLNKYKNIVIEKAEKETGFKISCENVYFKKSLTPDLNIGLYHTLILYPDNREFIKIKDGELKVKLLPLLWKKIDIKDVKLTRPVINIILYKDYSDSLGKYIKKSEQQTKNKYPLISITSDTHCQNYKLKITDESINKTFFLEGEELILKDIGSKEKVGFILKGALYEGKKQYLNYDLDITSALFENKNSFTFSPFKTIYETDIKGDIKGKLNIDKDNNINGNLNTENISLNINKTRLKNNNVDLEFKGKEVKITALLHTSEKDEIETTGLFKFGQNKSVNLSTKALNIDLTNLFNLISTVTKCLNIQNNYKDLKIKGLLNADFNLISDFKTIKSSGNAQLSNTEITHPKLPYKISGINSDIDMSNNSIKINNAELKINSTPVSVTGIIGEDVSLNLRAVSENLNLKDFLIPFNIDPKLPFKVNGGIANFKTNITGNLKNNIISNSDISISQLEIEDKNRKIPIKSDIVNISLNTTGNKYTGEINCRNPKIKIDKIPVYGKEFNVSFSEKEITVPENIVIIQNSEFKINGNIKDPMKNPVTSINYNGAIKSADLGNILNKYINRPYKAIGKLNAYGQILSAGGENEINAKIEADSNNYVSYTVIKELLNKPSVLNVELSQKENEIKIKDISLYENNKTETDKSDKILYSYGMINTKTKNIKDFNIVIPKKLSASSDFFGGEDFALKANILLNGDMNAPQIKGIAELYAYNIKKYLTSVKNAEITFNNNKAKITAPDIQINNSKINVTADATFDKNKKITVENMYLNSLNLDLNTLFPLFDKEISPFNDNFITVKKGTATINNFKVLDIKAKDISTDFSLNNNTLKVFDINSNAYGGTVTGNINVDILPLIFEINLNGTNIGLKDALYDLCKIDDNIAGTANFTSSITVRAGNYESAIKSLNGEIDFKSYNGRMGTLGKFEYYLYAQNILYHGFLKTTLNRIADAITKDNTAQYKFSNGTIKFNNGYAFLEDIKTNGKDMSLYLTGKHNLITNLANINIYGRISDEISSKLGSFGDFSFSEFFDASSTKTPKNIEAVEQDILDNIPLLTQTNTNTKTFKVNIFGKPDAINSINSFYWIIPKQRETNTEEKLPDFSDISEI